jgi:hypothetical protein
LWESRNTVFETPKRKFTQAFGRISTDELKNRRGNSRNLLEA